MPKTTKKAGEEPENKQLMKVMQLRPPKMKDRPVNRSRTVINCREHFGFLPELLFIDKVFGKHDTYIISAVVPKEMADKYEVNEPKPEEPTKSKKGKLKERNVIL